MTTIMIQVRTADVTVENFVQAATEGKVRFYRQRANGTFRHIPFLTGEEREVAEWVVEQREEEGKTMRQIADEMHLSVPSVRRMINSLLLVEEVEAYEADEIAEWLQDAADAAAEGETAPVAEQADEEAPSSPEQAPVAPEAERAPVEAPAAPVAEQA